jgi:hypothetical protein
VHPEQQYLTSGHVQDVIDAGAAASNVFVGHETAARRHVDAGPRTVHEITDAVIAADFAPEAIGRGLLELADRRHGVELAGQYAAILAKARLSRLDRQRRR